jgi:hypothetical protein
MGAVIKQYLCYDLFIEAAGINAVNSGEVNDLCCDASRQQTGA